MSLIGHVSLVGAGPGAESTKVERSTSISSRAMRSTRRRVPASTSAEFTPCVYAPEPWRTVSPIAPISIETIRATISTSIMVKPRATRRG